MSFVDPVQVDANVVYQALEPGLGWTVQTLGRRVGPGVDVRRALRRLCAQRRCELVDGCDSTYTRARCLAVTR